MAEADADAKDRAIEDLIEALRDARAALIQQGFNSLGPTVTQIDATLARYTPVGVSL